MSIKRSEFLRLSSWGLIASLLPLHQIRALSYIKELKSFDQDNYALAVQKASQAKEAFYNKNYTLAESLYLECINLAPADIRFYDNLQNVYGAQGQWLTIVELFKNGLIANPNKIVFYDRAARSLMRLELGYKTHADEYKNQINSASLLQDAKQLYNQAIAINPNAEYLRIGKRKVKQKIESDAININYITNVEEKEKRKNRRRKHKKRYVNFSIFELENKLLNIDNSNRQTLYFPEQIANREKNIVREKKLIHTLLVRRYKRDNNFSKAIEHANSIRLIDERDTRAIQQLKRLYRKTANFSELINLQRSQIVNKETVYAYLGLIKALNLKYRKEVNDQALLNESISICNNLINEWDLKDSIKTKVIDKLCDTYILNQEYTSAKFAITSYVEEQPKLSDGDIINLIFDYAKAHLKNHEYVEAEVILKIGIKTATDDEIAMFTDISNLVNSKQEDIFNNNLPLYYLLYRVYKKQNDVANMISIINILLQNNPEDNFALIRQNS